MVQAYVRRPGQVGKTVRLTDKHLEEILAGTRPEPARLDRRDRARLAEARQVRERLRSAFAVVTAGGSLTDRISTALRAAKPPASDQSKGGGNVHRRMVRVAWWLGAAGVAAAVMLVTAVLFNPAGSPAIAAIADLARIHEDNLAGTGEFLRTSDTGQIAECFRRRIGFSPRICTHHEDTMVVGCVVREYRRQAVPTYLLTVAGTRISVIATQVPLGDIGLSCNGGCDITDVACFHTKRSGECNIVSARVGDRTYLAVGAGSPDMLAEILRRLRACESFCSKDQLRGNE